MSDSVSFSREIPVRHRVDVFIAGGGPAGIAAAIAARRQGASVFLAESTIRLGGMGTSGGVAMFCVFTDGVNFLADGVGRRIYDGAFERGGASPRNSHGDRFFWTRPEVLAALYDELLIEAGAQVSLATNVVALECDEGWVRHVVCQGKSGFFAVEAGCYVDASGDGDCCAWAGAPFDKGDEQGRMQPGTYVSLWSGIDWAAAEAAGDGVWKQDRFLREAIAEGMFTVPDPSMPGMLPTSERSAHGVIGHLFGVDGCDERSITENAMLGRRIIREYEAYYKKYLTGFDQLELIAMAARLGIRETRRIRGDYQLCEDDYWARAVFDDEIGRYSYGIDLHAKTVEEAAESAEEFGKTWLPEGESYGIPYRSLCPLGLHNLLMAGRCISVDQRVLASLRVMPGGFITGQAAGTAAAICAARGCDIRGFGIDELQGRLKELGAYLPNAGC